MSAAPAMTRPVTRRGLAPLALGVAAIAAAGALAFAPVPRRAADAAPGAERLIRVEDAADGGVLVRDAATGRRLLRIPVAEGGFLRGTMRALARERRQEGGGSAAPFRLALWPDGQLTLEDTATGRRVDLTAFGSTNTGAFRHLLTTEGDEP